MLSRMSEPTPPPLPRRPALIFWRLFALLYDAFPVIAIWMVIAAIFVVGLTVTEHSDRVYVQPWSLLNWLEWVVCWVIAGLYAVMSWHRGGQTLGMRPWRLRVTAADGDRPTWRALWIRYAIGSLSLTLAGLGFWWAWIDRDRLTWHDRASGTRMRREAKR